MCKRVGAKISCVALWMERLYLELLKKDVPWKWGVGMLGICGRRRKCF